MKLTAWKPAFRRIIDSTSYFFHVARICAWCGVSVGFRTRVMGYFFSFSRTSHGICRKCLAKQYEVINNIGSKQ